MLRQYFNRIWHSPTLMTWGSFLTKSLSLIVVLPLLLTRFSTEEISLWYLFATIIGLQMLVDVGFSPTFSRVIAYAMGGAGISDLKNPKIPNSHQPNWSTVEQICSTMRYIYSRLNIIWTILLALLGTLAILRPVSQVDDVNSVWIAWGVILITSTISFRGNIYGSYLQGVNQIALLRRWEMFFSFGAIVTSFIVLLLDGGLLFLVIAHQAWQILNILRNRWLSGTVENGRFKQFGKSNKSKAVLDVVWPIAWRSGLGVLMSYGLVQASGIMYAQVGSTARVASYLLALRLIRTVSQFSQAPFYSKLPLLARLFSVGKRHELIRIAKRGMAFSHWAYVAGFFSLGLIGEPFLKFIGSNAEFPDPLLWSLLGIGIFAERYGAMHLQLYTTTNHIIWHTVTAVSGLIYVCVSLLLFPPCGVYAFPIAIISANLGFYSWFSAMHSYKAFQLRFLMFESVTSFTPAVIVLLLFLISAYMRTV